MRAHKVENGVVVNTIEVESLADFPGYIDGTEGGIGWLWDGQTLTPPPTEAPVPVPITVVSRRQGKQALLLAGKLADVQPAIAAIADATERQMAQIYWDDAQEFERNNATLNALADALGLTSTDVDNLFEQAATL